MFCKPRRKEKEKFVASSAGSKRLGEKLQSFAACVIRVVTSRCNYSLPGHFVDHYYYYIIISWLFKPWFMLLSWPLCTLRLFCSTQVCVKVLIHNESFMFLFCFFPTAAHVQTFIGTVCFCALVVQVSPCAVLASCMLPSFTLTASLCCISVLLVYNLSDFQAFKGHQVPWLAVTWQEEDQIVNRISKKHCIQRPLCDGCIWLITFSFLGFFSSLLLPFLKLSLHRSVWTYAHYGHRSCTFQIWFRSKRNRV